MKCFISVMLVFLLLFTAVEPLFLLLLVQVEQLPLFSSRPTRLKQSLNIAQSLRSCSVCCYQVQGRYTMESS